MTLPDEEAPVRPLWLMTLTDLSLLLVGFFVFLQASQVDPKILAASVRAGFGMRPLAMPAANACASSMFVAVPLALSFAPGSCRCALMTMRSLGNIVPGISATSVRSGLFAKVLAISTRTRALPAAAAFLSASNARVVALKPKALCVSSYGMLCQLSRSGLLSR